MLQAKHRFLLSENRQARKQSKQASKINTCSRENMGKSEPQGTKLKKMEAKSCALMKHKNNVK